MVKKMPASSTLEGSKSAVPPKKSLFEDESSSDDDQEEGGATLGGPSLKINEEYARRFEHNKKREELHRLEEKYKSSKNYGGDEDDSESSEDETEDEDAMLATEDLDAEISATLQAIKNKDPRIYDKSAVFYKPIDSEAAESSEAKEKKEKPVTLRDYHRQRYLAGDVGAEDDTDGQPQKKTYFQEQEELKRSVLSEIKAEMGEEEEWSDDDAFLKPKEGQDAEPLTENGMHPSRAAAIKVTKVSDLDVADADKNPEEFLSKFMASRAWASEGGSKWAAFESDDDDDGDEKAENFEYAYNMRFEDPATSNEILKSYSRNMAAERSVRKEELTGRKKQRALEKEKKEAEKRERQEERARLRRLKVDEASEKVAMIKKAAGLSGQALKEDDWMKFLDDAWDDDKWEEEMQKRFGEEYYAEGDGASDVDGEDGEKSSTAKKLKKPKWDDDIDIKDLVPDFDDESHPNFTLTDSEAEGEGQGPGEDEDDEDDEEERPAKIRKTSQGRKKDQINAKREARKERAKIEALVDARMELDNPAALASKSKTKMPAFRYRETSPQSFGMTAHDILLAPSDAALNEFAGLKKLATFRDADKKKKDKKHLGKKARLREWRRENFGREFERTGPTYGFEKLIGHEAAPQEAPAQNDGEKKKRKRKRSRNNGGKAEEGEKEVDA